MLTFLTILLALALDALLGDPPNRYHPVVAMGSFIRAFARRTPTRFGWQQFGYGMAFMLLGLLLFSLPFYGINLLFSPYPAAQVIINALLLKSVFALRRLLEAGQEVEKALAAGDLPAARQSVSWHLVSRRTDELDTGHVASATVESLAENLTDSFLAPLLAFALGGLPLAFAYRFANTADAMIGYHGQFYEYLGKFAARLDDLLNWIPARLAGLLIVLAAPMGRGSSGKAWQTMWQQHRRTSSPNAGWPMSAAAGALGVVLEKINHYRLEGGEELPEAAHIARARRLILWAAGLWVIISAACTLISMVV